MARSPVRGDILAGVTVAALVVPKNLGYAEIAGVPIENGLYAAAAGASDTVRQRMMTAFIRCSQYEWLFWDGAYQLRGWPVG